MDYRLFSTKLFASCPTPTIRPSRVVGAGSPEDQIDGTYGLCSGDLAHQVYISLVSVSRNS